METEYICIFYLVSTCCAIPCIAYVHTAWWDLGVVSK